MRISKFAAALALGVSAVGLSGCATGFPAQVSRFQAMPAPQGQSFVVVPMVASDVGGLEFSQYASMVSQAMQAQGYVPAATMNQATMVVRLGYGVDQGQTEYQTFPGGYGGLGYGGFGYGGFGRYGRPYYSRWGAYGRSPFFYGGWGDPFWGNDVSSYTVYRSFLDLDIRRKADNAGLFEGHAKARSGSDNLQTLVPNLIEAMFTGFPGRSGEVVRITVPPPVRR